VIMLYVFRYFHLFWVWRRSESDAEWSGWFLDFNCSDLGFASKVAKRAKIIQCVSFLYIRKVKFSTKIPIIIFWAWKTNSSMNQNRSLYLFTCICLLHMELRYCTDGSQSLLEGLKADVYFSSRRPRGYEQFRYWRRARKAARTI